MDRWSAAEAYDPYVGRWSRRLAPRFLEWARVPRGCVLDVGCGTGALTEALLAHGATGVLGLDASAAYAQRARARNARAGVALADAARLPVGARGFDAAVSGLVLNFLPDARAAVTGAARAVRPGGVVAAYVWDYAEGMQMMRTFWDAAVALSPDVAGPLDEGRRFPLCRPEPLRALFESAGLRDVAVAPLDEPTRFRDFDDYWTPFLGGQGPAPGYAASLPPEARDALRDAVRARLPVGPDGTIPLVARAWGVRGEVP